MNTALIISSIGISCALAAPALADLITYASPVRQVVTRHPTYGPDWDIQSRSSTSLGAFGNVLSVSGGYSWNGTPTTVSGEARQTSFLDPTRLYVQQLFALATETPSDHPMNMGCESTIDVWVTLQQDFDYWFTGSRGASFSITDGPSGPRSGSGSIHEVGTLLAGTYHVQFRAWADNNGLSSAVNGGIGIPSPGVLGVVGVGGFLTCARRRCRT